MEATEDEIADVVADDIMEILMINREIVNQDKIRIISISRGFVDTNEKYNEAIVAAEKEGIKVLTPNDPSISLGLSREDYADSDETISYKLSHLIKRGDAASILVPMDKRTVASSNDSTSYRYDSYGAISWVVPYMAGLYALSLQVEPTLTYDEFIIALQTTSVDYMVGNSREGKIVQPLKLIEYLLAFE